MDGTMWQIDLGEGVTASEDSLLQGEYAMVYSLVAGGLPHAEVDVDPLHCPLCRQSFIAVLRTTRRGGNLVAELAAVGGMLRGDVVALVRRVRRDDGPAAAGATRPVAPTPGPTPATVVPV